MYRNSCTHTHTHTHKHSFFIRFNNKFALVPSHKKARLHSEYYSISHLHILLLLSSLHLFSLSLPGGFLFSSNQPLFTPFTSSIHVPSEKSVCGNVLPGFSSLSTKRTSAGKGLIAQCVGCKYAHSGAQMQRFARATLMQTHKYTQIHTNTHKTTRRGMLHPCTSQMDVDVYGYAHRWINYTFAQKHVYCKLNTFSVHTALKLHTHTHTQTHTEYE